MDLLIFELPPVTLAKLSVEELSSVSLKDISLYFRRHKSALMGVIYSYTNKINGRKYIGQTKSPQRRQYEHKYCSLKKINPHLPINRALQRYGLNYFEYSILMVCFAENANELQLLLDRNEREFISLFATNTARGYNVSVGGVSGNSGRKNLRSKPVCQYDKSGCFVASYESLSLAAKAVNTVYFPPRVLQLPYGTFKGYYWRTVKVDRIEVVKKPRLKHCVVVHRYGLDGCYIDSFESCADAALAVNGLLSNIASVAKSPCTKSAYGYRWSIYKVDHIPATFKRKEYGK